MKTTLLNLNMARGVKLEVNQPENVKKCRSMKLIDQIEAKDGIHCVYIH